ncbi:MAG TPA: isovaleryl-CoA dehydrogenase [Burkholderiales bacterium]|nr:isovaleryl-CoA dehydrogenase [Burkholderiales bacterium]
MSAQLPSSSDPVGAPPARFSTHEVFNQPAPLENYNLYLGDRALDDALAFNLPPARLQPARERLAALGAELGTAESFAKAEIANRHTPQLHTHDRRGERRDEIEYHPAYHELMALLMRHGLHTGAWADGTPGAHVERAAGYLLYAEVENGTQCPATMTYGSVPAIRRDPGLSAAWLDKLYSRDYDPRNIPARDKRSVLVGMGMTEKQGGSDVRANTSRAVRAGDAWSITGHKWFLSAPMCDAWLVLAQTERGLSCFFMPRYRPDGTLNAIRIQRLKEKLGNRSNASSEVEFQEAYATLLGDEGRGVPMILEMGVYTRLDCAISGAGLMRQALAQALWNAAQREVFGKRLRDQPLMKNVLADLALESEAATALAIRVSRAYDAQVDERERLLARVLTPAAKFWVCKRGAHFAEEAMEAIGGSGYVEESSLARIYREVPVNSIWEGSGNIMCLDVLRALRKSPDIVDALDTELDAARGAHPAYDRFRATLKGRVADAAMHESSGRRLTQDLTLAVQASLLARHAPRAVSEAFCASRLQPEFTGVFGALAPDTPFDALIERAMPAPAPRGQPAR